MAVSRCVRIVSVMLALCFLGMTVGAEQADAGKKRWWKHRYFHHSSGKDKVWMKKYDNGKRRFKVLRRFSEEAVLDRETYLIWQKQAGATTMDFFAANKHCNELELGGRRGWHLPTIVDIQSLLLPNGAENKAEGVLLPAEHPFMGLKGGVRYWTTSMGTGTPVGAVDVATGDIKYLPIPGWDDPAVLVRPCMGQACGVDPAVGGPGMALPWCVRGESNGYLSR